MTHKTVLITGTSTGIGNATALHFAANGWNVAATVRNKSDVFFDADSPHARNFLLDVTHQEECEKVMHDVLKTFGGLDVLINNAGLATMGPFEETSETAVQDQFQTNVFGALTLTKSVLPYFRKQRQGTIVVLSITAGRVGIPLYSIHCASKSALEGFFESLRFEVKPFNINIRIIEPGSYRSEIISNGNKYDRIQVDGVYEKNTQKQLDGLRRYDVNRKDPREVAEAIWNAVHNDSNQLRYVVGEDALKMVKIRKEMTDEQLFSMMGKNFENA